MDTRASSFQESYPESFDGMRDTPAGETVGANHFMRLFSWDRLARIILYLIIGILPFWVLPFTVFPIAISKSFLFAILILFAFIAWLVGRIQEGEVLLPKHMLAFSLFLLVLVAFVSGLFSVGSHISFIGLGHEPDTAISLAFFALGAFLMSFLFREKHDTTTLFVIVGASSLILFFFQLLHMFLGITIWGSVFPTPSSNPIGSWNAFGFYASFLSFLFLFLAKNSEGKNNRIFFYAVSVAAFVMMIAVNFRTAWILYAVFTVILFAYLYSFKRERHVVHWEPLAFLLVALFFLITPVLGQSVSALFGGETVEVRPSWQASWDVARSTIAGKTLLFGSGPNTFLYDWLLYKPLAVNQTVFWGTRFTSGVSFFLTLFTTLGVAGAIAVLLLTGSLLFYGFRAILRFALLREASSFVVIVFLGVLYLFLGLLIYTPGFFIVLFFFLFLGLFMGQAAGARMLGDVHVRLFQNAGMGFVSALLVLLLSVSSIAGIYLLGQKYVAAFYYGKGIAHFNEDRDFAAAREDFVRAIRLDERDQYLRSLADTDLLRMNELLGRRDLPPEELRSLFQTTLGQAIQSAQRASELNPVDPLNWTSLGRIYEAVIPFNIEGAAAFASDMYERAHARSPRSPEALFFRARVNAQTGNSGDARVLLREANEIKTDYAPARFLLAQIEVGAGNISEAIQEMRNTQFLVPNDIGVLFQLGLLYYQDGQFENARIVFERAVELNPNYSNARYFLGLLYDRAGNTETAIAHFEQIEALNPANAEVKKILFNMRKGKAALEGIAPPPEERKTPPLDE